MFENEAKNVRISRPAWFILELNCCLLDSTTSKLRGFAFKLNNTSGILTAARILSRKKKYNP